VVTHFSKIAGVLIVSLMLGAVALAQDKPAEPPQPAPPTSSTRVIPVRVQVVLTRVQGTKEISRLPYTLVINANDGGQSRATLRMGSQVPVKSTTFAPVADGKGPTQPLSSYSYRDIGTSIDCGPVTLTDGRYRFNLAIEDTSVYADTPAPAERSSFVDAPAFRSFRNSTYLALRDGESTQFAAATDRINGEVVRVEVTLNVVK
jgi:hypothetical protein